MIKVLFICGARPNFMKIAPLVREMNARDGFTTRIVHTGQHYDERMSALFFDELNIPAPDINLEVGSGTHAQQTAAIMERFEPVLEQEKPDWVLVVGDVNSTIACALVAKKLHFPVAHVEAGLRSFDRGMPEEINRVLTDSISDLLFVTEPSGVENLKDEGRGGDDVHLVGNVMIDTLVANRAHAQKSTVLKDAGLREKGYALITMHRPSNVDVPEMLLMLVEELEAISQDHALVWPLHPRTRARLEAAQLMSRVEDISTLLPPQGYLDFLKLMESARIVVTDSGGIQEETTILGVPCVTVRENTERPVTIDEGTNRLCPPTGPGVVVRAVKEALAAPPPKAPPALWDGKSAARIVDVFAARAKAHLENN